MADDDFGEVKKDDAKKEEAKPSTNTKEIADKKRRDLFFGQEDANDLDLDQIDIDKLDMQNFDNKNEDKFNQVLSTSKENGGLLASIGLKKGADNDDSIGDESQEEDDPHKKSDLFDNSKDKGRAKDAKKVGEGVQSDEDDFDLGFASSKKAGDEKAGKEKADDGPNMSDLDDDENNKIIDEQFKQIYEKDPELRKALEKSDVSTFTTFEKFQILEAYTQGGGASALQIELADDDDDEAILNEMSEEDKQHLEEQFDRLYAQDPVLQEELGPLQNLNLQQKYSILIQYHRAGESSAMVGTSQGGYASEDTEIIEIDGKKFRRVQIEDKDEEYLMDEE